MKKETYNLIKYLLLIFVHQEEILKDFMKDSEFIEILSCGTKESDFEIILDCLDCIYLLLNQQEYKKFIINFLYQNSTVNMIEKLQLNKNSRVSESSVKIIEIILEFETMEK